MTSDQRNTSYQSKNLTSNDTLNKSDQCDQIDQNNQGDQSDQCEKNNQIEQQWPKCIMYNKVIIAI